MVTAGEGGSHAGHTLARFDPDARVSETEILEAPAVMRELVGQTHADGVVLPLAVEQFPSARDSWGETVLFSPTVALTDQEVDSRWQEIAELAG